MGSTPYDSSPLTSAWWSAIRLRFPFLRVPPEGGRRLLNVVVAGIGLVGAAPLMCAIALVIKLTSPGPVFYAQPRVGLDRRNPLEGMGNSRRRNYGGRLFRIYKFRTMRWDPSHRIAQAWATPDDPRITQIGRILRKYRLDELPQLFNVLRGEMNVVGPRPEQPEIAVRLRSQIQGYQHRQRVRPGITGWAQINHHYDVSLDDVRRKVAYDLQYVARHSLLEDLKIMVQTAPVVMFRRGAW